MGAVTGRAPDSAAGRSVQPGSHRQSLAAAIRSAQSGITSVTGTVVTVPVRAAASSS